MNSCSMIRLPSFLQDLKAAFESSPPADPSERTSPALTRDQVKSFVETIRGPLALVNSSGLLADAFHALKLGRDEVRNANLLAWLLLWRNGHGLEAKLLDALISVVTKELNLPPISSSKHCTVSTETLADGGTESRVDIFVNDPGILLIIEVKIDAREQSQQLDRYCEIARRRAGGRPWAVVYLTPDGRAALSGLVSPEKIVRVSWIDIARIARTIGRGMHRHTVTGFLVGSFVRHIEDKIGGTSCKVTTKTEQLAH